MSCTENSSSIETDVSYTNCYNNISADNENKILSNKTINKKNVKFDTNIVINDLQSSNDTKNININSLLTLE